MNDLSTPPFELQNMARIIQDREDLFAEATALPYRVKLTLHAEQDDSSESMVIGFRSNGAISFFFSANHVYHFNQQDQLRRAFVNGVKYKAEHGKLHSLVRQPGNNQMKFHAVELTAEKVVTWCRLFFQYKEKLQRALELRQFNVVAQTPSDAKVVARINKWLQQFGEVINFASSAGLQDRSTC